MVTVASPSTGTENLQLIDCRSPVNRAGQKDEFENGGKTATQPWDLPNNLARGRAFSTQCRPLKRSNRLTSYPSCPGRSDRSRATSTIPGVPDCLLSWSPTSCTVLQRRALLAAEAFED